MKTKKLLLATLLSVVATTPLFARDYFVVVPVPGKVAAPTKDNLALSRGSLDFGASQRYDVGLPLSITLTNAGDKPLSISKMAVPDAGAAEGFSVQHDCTVLAPSASCQAYVYYRPIAAGVHDSSLAISHDGNKLGASTVSLHGIAKDPSASLDVSAFGQVNVGSAKDVIAVFKNTGIGNITVGNPTATGAGFSVVDSDCPSPLAPADSCSVTTRFTALTPGDQAGVLSVPSGAGAITANLSGFGVSSDLQFTSGPVAAFGGVAVGSSSVSKTITLKNSGNIAANDLALKVVDTTGYTIENSNCGTSLAAGDTCSFSVRFSPADPGAYLGNLTATVGGKTLASSPLSGVGTSAAIFLTAPTGTSYNLIGTTTPEYYTFSNSSSSSVTINSKSLSFPTSTALLYTFGGGTSECASVVPAKSTCRINFTVQSTDSYALKPLALTLNTSAGKITDNHLSIGGSWAKLSPSPANPSFDFGSVTIGASALSAKVKVTDLSIGTALSDVTYFLPDGFTLENSTCGDTSGRQAVCEFTVKFSPAAAKAYAGTFSMTTRTRPFSNTTGTPQPYTLSIPLTGTGVAPASISWQGDVTGVVEQGESRAVQMTLYNPGSASVALGAVSLSGNTAEFSLAGTTCTSSLASKSGCTATVNFKPTGAGSRPQATISALAGGVAVSKAITGTGGTAVLTTTPAVLTYGNRYVNNSSIAYDAFQDISVTLKNTGTAAAEHLTGDFTYNDAGVAFSFQNNSCVNRLNAGASCTTSVRASGNGIGSHSGTVFFKSSSGLVSIPFTFTIVPMDVRAVTVTGVQDTAVGKGSLSTYTVTTNSTGKVVTETPSISGNTAEYSLAAGSNCGGIILVNASCAINVLFTPTATGPRPQASLNIKVGGVMNTIPLNGSGLAP
jgi:hypothetical protein